MLFIVYWFGVFVVVVDYYLLFVVWRIQFICCLLLDRCLCLVVARCLQFLADHCLLLVSGSWLLVVCCLFVCCLLLVACYSFYVV